VLLPRYVRHVLTRFRRKRRDRQRVAEYVQVIRQVLARGALLVHPRVSFGRPLTYAELRSTADPGAVRETIARHARHVLSSHLAAPPAAPGEAERGRLSIRRGHATDRPLA
jgi:hypothetical protein